MDSGDPRAAVVLSRFGLGSGARIGAGGESAVYALDDHRVLRVLRSDIDVAPRATKAFLATAAGVGLPFLVPEILETGSVDGVGYSIERRVPGRPLLAVLADASTPLRTRAVESFAHAVFELERIPVPDDRFGELFTEAPRRSSSWPDLLVARARASVERAGASLRDDVPDVDARLEEFARNVARLDVGRPRFVHGDYFPGNVLVDDDGAVTGVIDFSALALAGDPVLDLAGALAFLPLHAHTASDVDVVSHVIRSHERAIGIVDLDARLDLYTVYYALFFSFTRGLSDALYPWCVATLREG